MSDKVEDVKASAEAVIDGMDGLVEERADSLRDRFGVSSLSARLIDAISIGLGLGGMAYGASTQGFSGWFLVGLGMLLFLGGLFGFLNNLGDGE